MIQSFKERTCTSATLWLVVQIIECAESGIGLALAYLPLMYGVHMGLLQCMALGLIEPKMTNGKPS